MRILTLTTIFVSKVFIFFWAFHCASVSANTSTEAIKHLSLTSELGQPITIEKLAPEGAIYLKFWASWCKTCMEQMPHLEKVHQTYGRKLSVIAVNIGIEDGPVEIAAVKKRYSLTMPVVTDHSGMLAKAFKFVGTPYHVLINGSGDWLYQSYALGDELKAAILKSISTTAKKNVKSLAPQPIAGMTNSGLAAINKQGTQLLFFNSTWCQSYFKDNRPDLSQRCSRHQGFVNTLNKKYPKLHVLGIMNPWWTDKNALADYKKTENINYPTVLDNKRIAFEKYQVTGFSTILLIKDGVEVARWQNLKSSQELERVLMHF